ncbi:hypothetical protein BBJ28_00025243 [Nothophytophthora sp. Chile5]|nr:hypothetical protein BBJ28_00025243 [Nothophytophthora sp. Chile5]
MGLSDTSMSQRPFCINRRTAFKTARSEFARVRGRRDETSATKSTKYCSVRYLTQQTRRFRTYYNSRRGFDKHTRLTFSIKISRTSLEAQDTVDSGADAGASAESADNCGGVEIEKRASLTLMRACPAQWKNSRERAGASGTWSVGEGRAGDVTEDEAAAPDEAIALGGPVAGTDTTDANVPGDVADADGGDTSGSNPGVAGDDAPGDDVAEGNGDGVDMNTKASNNHGR